jgi:hypothetical protein
MPEILLTKICHLANKMDELSVVAAQHKPSVVLLNRGFVQMSSMCRSNFQGSIFPGKIDLTGNGGVVAMYVLAGIKCRMLTVLEYSEFEVLSTAARPKGLLRSVCELPRGQGVEPPAIGANPPLLIAHLTRRGGGRVEGTEGR